MKGTGGGLLGKAQRLRPGEGPRSVHRPFKGSARLRDDIGGGSVNDALADLSDAVVREVKKLEDELTEQVNEKTRAEGKPGGRGDKGDKGGT
ncbi:hypothetical protein SUDANB176_04302 [Streptomyces sp. enrichment culture]|uniref:hypothetical protein n=1 Tax=Streptomyces sp. enrichment culture TaxID=1795815 RepID=UPI003F575D17